MRVDKFLNDVRESGMLTEFIPASMTLNTFTWKDSGGNTRYFSWEDNNGNEEYFELEIDE